MTVAEIERREFSLPLESPLSTASGEIERREGIALRLGDGTGTIGVGEATPLPGWTESLDECRATLSTLEESRPGAWVYDLDLKFEFESEFDDRPAARHGLSLACSDRASRRAERPLYRQLGGERRVDRVAVNATVGDASLGETVEAAREAVEAGFDTVKCKVGSRSLDEDIDRVRAIRDAVDPDVSLRLDANGAWDRHGAEQALVELADLDGTVEYVEQPLSPNDVEGHRALAGGPVPIALDETLAGRSFEGIDGLVDAADVLVLKPMALGGPDRAVDLGRRMREAGLGIVITTTIDAVLARTAAVHVAAALDVERACGLATAGLLARDLGTDPTTVRDGAISVPQAPGLGTDGPWGEGNA